MQQCSKNLKALQFLCIFQHVKAHFRGHFMAQNHIPEKKILHRETLNFLTCADSRTDTKTDWNRQKRQKNKKTTCVACQVKGVRCPVSHVSCHMSYVKFYVSLVACQLSPVTNTNRPDPPPANSLIMQNRVNCKDKKNCESFKTQKILELRKPKNV